MINARTSSAWPSGVTFGKMCSSVWSGPITNVVRSMPHHFLAVHVLFLQHAKLFAHFLVYISKECVRQVVLGAEFGLVACGVSRLMPRTTAPAACSFLKVSRKPQASMVQPGVSALG